MHLDIFTLFPGMFQGPFNESILKRAQERSLLSIDLHNIRDATTDKHHIVDDYPYGGGAGMVMKPDPIFASVEAVYQSGPIILLTPQAMSDPTETARQLVPFALVPQNPVLSSCMGGADVHSGGEFLQPAPPAQTCDLMRALTGSNEVMLSGTIGKMANVWREDIALANPALFAAESLINALEEQKITLRGVARPDVRAAYAWCRRYTRAFLHHLCKCGEILAARLLTYHTLFLYQTLMQSLRAKILNSENS